MIRRFTVTALVGTAAVAGLFAGLAAGSDAPVTPAAMVTSLGPADGPHGDDRDHHGPEWDGRHGDWDGRSGFGRGGGWDGNGGGWDELSHRWWVSPDRCLHGHGLPLRDHFGWTCRGGIFNGAPIR